MVQGRMKFSEGERVLCFHGPLIYEAKCIKSRTKDHKNEYLVHYAGWNKKWDEYVPETRMLKYNDTNIQKQKSLKDAHVANVKAKKQSRSSTSSDNRRRRRDVSPSTSVSSATAAPASTGSEESGSRKRRREGSAAALEQTPEAVRKDSDKDSTVETEEQYMTKVEVNIKLPDDLKLWLVDDWDFINRQAKLYHIPASVTASQCLDDYLKHKISSKISASKLSAVREVVEGIKEYFNVMLGTQLLYKFERTQYADILGQHKDTAMCQLYAPIHVVRLLVKLGPMLSYTDLDEKSTSVLQSHIQDFLRYMVRNVDRYFSAEHYYVAPADYHRRSL